MACLVRQEQTVSIEAKTALPITQRTSDHSPPAPSDSRQTRHRELRTLHPKRTYRPCSFPSPSILPLTQKEPTRHSPRRHHSQHGYPLPIILQSSPALTELFTVDLGGSLAVASKGLFATGVSTDLNGTWPRCGSSKLPDANLLPLTVTYLNSGGKIGDTLRAVCFASPPQSSRYS